MNTGTRHLSEARKCSKEHKYRLGSTFKVAQPLLFKTTDGNDETLSWVVKMKKSRIKSNIYFFFEVSTNT